MTLSFFISVTIFMERQLLKGSVNERSIYDL